MKQEAEIADDVFATESDDLVSVDWNEGEWTRILLHVRMFDLSVRDPVGGGGGGRTLKFHKEGENTVCVCANALLFGS